MTEAGTDRGRLRAGCLWLVAEAVRHHQLTEVLLVILDLVYRVQKRLPLPDPAPGSPGRRIHATVAHHPFAHSTSPARKESR